MDNRKITFKTERELQEAILKEKARGTPDFEIGQKYGVTFRYIERLITKTQGLNISALKVSKKIKRLHPKDFKCDSQIFKAWRISIRLFLWCWNNCC
ncbi:hypothetical protein M1N61_00800 [Peptococcaceae bacterium]|nr:hypothetical protein [Peptococcaceae bacterium]